MTTILVVGVVVAAAVVLGVVARRRRPDAPTAPGHSVPEQLDRDDFDAPGTPWLLALFSSSTCLSCRDAWEVVGAVADRSVVVQRLDLATDRDRHRRYGIDAVPTVVLADADGVVRWSSLGPPSAAALADALDRLGVVPRDDGTAVDIGGG